MGIFSRLAQLIKSNLNDLISRSEDPEKMLNQLVLEMSTQLNEAKKQVAASIADEKKLAKQVEQELAKATEWEQRAMMALKNGNEELAREALARKREHDGIAVQYQEQWTKQKTAVENLKRTLRALNDKIEEAKRKKNVLIARKKRAEAQRAIQETMSGMQDASAFETFDKMAERIDRMEAEAEAGAELQEEYSGDVLASKFAQLEKVHGADEDLIALKRKMGLLPPEEPKAAIPEKARVEAPAGLEGVSEKEQAELAAALEEMEAEQQQQESSQGQQKKAGR
jgi:phage shock protein A